MQEFLSAYLPILIYILLCILIVLLIIISVKVIKTMNRVESIVDDVDEKVKSLNGVFNVVVDSGGICRVHSSGAENLHVGCGDLAADISEDVQAVAGKVDGSSLGECECLSIGDHGVAGKGNCVSEDEPVAESDFGEVDALQGHRSRGTCLEGVIDGDVFDGYCGVGHHVADGDGLSADVQNIAVDFDDSDICSIGICCIDFDGSGVLREI